MQIRITIDATEPLTGTAVVSGIPAVSGIAPRRFTGWLELLSAIAALVDAAARRAGSDKEALDHGGAGGNGTGHG